MTTTSTKTGYFYKRGGTGGGWKKRYFVLNDSELEYFKTEDSGKPKGVIDLTEGRGVREKGQCKNVDWPSEAKDELCFGLATKSRTFYIYAADMTSIQDWVGEIQQTIQRVGKATEDWENDVEGKPESKVSKAVRNAVVFVTKITKKAVSESGVLSEDQVAVVEAGATAIENQAEADPNTSLKARAKMGVKDGAGVAGHGLGVAGEYVPDEYGQAAVKLVGGVLVDQSEADDGLSAKQRLALVGGSAIQGASGFAGDVQPVADTLDVLGGVVKDQAEADEDLNWKQRAALAAESAANGVGELESLEGNEIAQTATYLVKTGAEKAREVLEEEEEEEEEEYSP